MEFPAAADIAKEVEDLLARMSTSEAVSNPSVMKELSRSHGDKQELLAKLVDYERVIADLDDARAMLEAGDEEMREMLEAEVPQLENRSKLLENEIESLLVEKDPRDARDVIVEIRAGAGGDEAALFAAELFRGYVRYAETHDWKAVIASTSTSDQGGYKEVVAEFSGKNVFGTLKHERGVHRVQRIPETEKQGRVHTSTITVAVMPEAEEVDIEIKPDDLRIDTYRSGGAGGQHLNKTSSAVRITHLPTNTVVAVQDERSQHKNKEKAMKILRAKLLEQQEEALAKQQAAERKGQVGTGDRSEKIRTYNFPQDRITDHRLKESWSNIPAVMDGQMDEIFDAMKNAERAALLAAAT